MGTASQETCLDSGLEPDEFSLQPGGVIRWRIVSLLLPICGDTGFSSRLPAVLPKGIR